jgi:hypothetical protein
MIPEEAGGKLSYGTLSVSFPDAESGERLTMSAQRELS